MRPHYESMKAFYDRMEIVDTKELCADIISVLAMTMGGSQECLKFRMLGMLTNLKKLTLFKVFTKVNFQPFSNFTRVQSILKS